MPDLEAPAILVVEPILPDIPAEKPVPGVTRYTWLLVGLLLVIFALSFRLHARPPIRHNVRYSGRLIVIGLEWGLFYIAYRGIRASNLSLRKVLGRGWTSGWQAWDDLKDAILIVVLIYISTAVFHNIEPFRRTGALQPITPLHFFLAVAAAVSAGYCEEVAFRGFLFQQFRLLWNPTAAFLVQALFFAVWHGGNQSITQFLKHFISGCLFAHYAVKRNSLWPGILGHALLDTTAMLWPFIQFFILNIPA